MKFFLPLVAFLATSTANAFVQRPPSSMRPASRTHSTATSLNLVDDPKVVFITGGSQGLGQAMAYEIASAGHICVINYIKGLEDQAEETCAEIKKLGGDAIGIVGDVTSQDDCTAMMKEAFEKYGHVDVVINNAGTYQTKAQKFVF